VAKQKKTFFEPAQPECGKLPWLGFRCNFGVFQKCGLSRLNADFRKKSGLSRLNPNFWKKYQWACGGKGL